MCHDDCIQISRQTLDGTTLQSHDNTQQKGEGLLASCSNGNPGLHLAVQTNNFLKSRQSLRILQAVILLLAGLER